MTEITQQAANKQIEKLKEEIALHDYRYYVLDDPIIPDSAYDQLYKDLKRLEAQCREALRVFAQGPGEVGQAHGQESEHDVLRARISANRGETAIRRGARRVRPVLRGTRSREP
jgi:DNA ligase (NAD+)